MWRKWADWISRSQSALVWCTTLVKQPLQSAHVMRCDEIWWAVLAIIARIFEWKSTSITFALCSWAQLPWNISWMFAVANRGMFSNLQSNDYRLRRGEWIWPYPSPIYTALETTACLAFTWSVDFNMLSYWVAMSCMYRWITFVSTGVSLSKKKMLVPTPLFVSAIDVDAV